MKIIVVDDENICRKILKKNMELIGDCTAVNNSQEALSLISTAFEEKKPYDLITLDISMPLMSGQELLVEIRKREKEMGIPKDERSKIIMVTSRMNMPTIKACIKSGCNAYIAKPINKKQLFSHLKKLGVDTLEGEENKNAEPDFDIMTEFIHRFNSGKIELPVLPHIVQEIQDLLSGSEPSTEDLAKIIEKDGVMSTKLISVANSPLYKGTETVTSVNAALIRLGLKEAQSIITTITNKNLYNSDNSVLKDLLNKLWMHSLACATCGKLIAEALGMDNLENIFLMGIIHDIGKMLLIKAVQDITPNESFENQEIQLAIHEIHTSFGAILIKKWGFSEEFINIADLHHWNRFPEGTAKELLIINLADALSQNIGFGFFDFRASDGQSEEALKEGDRISFEDLESFKQLGLDSDRLLEIGEKAKNIIKESSKVF